MDLSRQQVEALEAVRNGGDVAFQLLYHFALNDVSNPTQYAQASDGHHISQSDWIRLL